MLSFMCNVRLNVRLCPAGCPAGCPAVSGCVRLGPAGSGWVRLGVRICPAGCPDVSGQGSPKSLKSMAACLGFISAQDLWGVLGLFLGLRLDTLFNLSKNGFIKSKNTSESDF